jgi:hypothetical protein
MRYIVQPHKHNERFSHDGGSAVIDTAFSVQVGWYASKDTALDAAAEFEINPIDSAEDLPRVKWTRPESEAIAYERAVNKFFENATPEQLSEWKAIVNAPKESPEPAEPIENGKINV